MTESVDNSVDISVDGVLQELHEQPTSISTPSVAAVNSSPPRIDDNSRASEQQQQQQRHSPPLTSVHLSAQTLSQHTASIGGPGAGRDAASTAHSSQSPSRGTTPRSSATVQAQVDEAARKKKMEEIRLMRQRVLTGWETAVGNGTSPSPSRDTAKTTTTTKVEEVPESAYVQYLYGKAADQDGVLYANASERTRRLNEALAMAGDVADFIRKWQIERGVHENQLPDSRDIENLRLLMENFLNREDLDRMDIERTEAAERLRIVQVRADAAEWLAAEAWCDEDRHLVLEESPPRDQRSNSDTTEYAMAASKVYTDEYQQRIMDSRKPDEALAAQQAYPFIGFTLRHRALDMYVNILVVDELYQGGPAHQVGIRTGDIITRVGDKYVRTLRDMDAAVAKFCRTAQFVNFTLTDTGNQRNFDVNLWIMTKDPTFAQYPFYFETATHGKIAINKRGRSTSHQVSPPISRQGSRRGSRSTSEGSPSRYERRDSSQPSNGLRKSPPKKLRSNGTQLRSNSTRSPTTSPSNKASPQRDGGETPHFMLPVRPKQTVTERAMAENAQKLTSVKKTPLTSQRRSPGSTSTTTIRTPKIPPIPVKAGGPPMPTSQKKYHRKKH